MMKFGELRAEGVKLLAASGAGQVRGVITFPDEAARGLEESRSMASLEKM